MRRARAFRGALGILAGPLALAGALLAAPSAPLAAPGPGELPIELSASIGTQIDREERDRWGLFPGIPGFVSGTITRRDGHYSLHYEQETAGGTRQGSRRLSEESVAAAQRVIALGEEYELLRTGMAGDPALEAAILRRMALRYSLDQEHDLAVRLLEAAERSDPDIFARAQGARLLDGARLLAGTRSSLFRADPLRSGSGRNDLLLFSGYYGLWLGAAVPAALDADSPELYSAGLLIIPPATIGVAHLATRNRNISEAEATMIALGGNFGLWQGLGWSEVAADEFHEGRDTVRWGLAAGLAGIALGAALSNDDMTEGHASLTDAGAWWGTWFGLLVAIADEAPDQAWKFSLIGGDLGVTAGYLGARNSRFTEGRVRILNMGGALGAVAGLGFMGLIRSDDDRVGAAALGVGSVTGALIALRATQPAPRPSGSGLTWSPRIQPHRTVDGVVPALALAASF